MHQPVYLYQIESIYDKLIFSAKFIYPKKKKKKKKKKNGIKGDKSEMVKQTLSWNV